MPILDDWIITDDRLASGISSWGVGIPVTISALYRRWAYQMISLVAGKVGQF